MQEREASVRAWMAEQGKVSLSGAELATAVHAHRRHAGKARVPKNHASANEHASEIGEGVTRWCISDRRVYGRRAPAQS